MALPSSAMLILCLAGTAPAGSSGWAGAGFPREGRAEAVAAGLATAGRAAGWTGWAGVEDEGESLARGGYRAKFIIASSSVWRGVGDVFVRQKFPDCY